VEVKIKGRNRNGERRKTTQEEDQHSRASFSYHRVRIDFTHLKEEKCKGERMAQNNELGFSFRRMTVARVGVVCMTIRVMGSRVTD